VEEAEKSFLQEPQCKDPCEGIVVPKRGEDEEGSCNNVKEADQASEEKQAFKELINAKVDVKACAEAVCAEGKDNSCNNIKYAQDKHDHGAVWRGNLYKVLCYRVLND